MSVKCYLIGAGPGDPGLFTLKGKELLEKAKVVIHDNLVSDAILNMIPREADVIYVGKKAGNHHKSQEQINRILVAECNALKKLQGDEEHVVVRLKGGDPYIFGRGPEEISHLIENDIPFEVIPGISSCYSVPSYAGIPLTHRECASGFSVVTGHYKKGCENDDLLTPGTDTVVYLMGLSNLSRIVSANLKSGRPPETPVAVISRGCTDEQKTRVGTLKTIQQILEEHPVPTPAIVVVGQVISYRDQLNWFEKV